jgi:uncharacterized protein YwbE
VNATGSDDETFAYERYPSSSSGHDALPLDRLVLDTADALDPSLLVNLAFATVDPDTEDTFGGLVPDDFSPLTLGVLEQVSSGQDGRAWVVNGLDVGAVMREDRRGLSIAIGCVMQILTKPRLTRRGTCECP